MQMVMNKWMIDVYKHGETVEHDSSANRYARIRLGFSENAKVFVNDEEIQYVQNLSLKISLLNLARNSSHLL